MSKSNCFSEKLNNNILSALFFSELICDKVTSISLRTAHDLLMEENQIKGCQSCFFFKYELYFIRDAERKQHIELFFYFSVQTKFQQKSFIISNQFEIYAKMCTNNIYF